MQARVLNALVRVTQRCHPFSLPPDRHYRRVHHELQNMLSCIHPSRHDASPGTVSLPDTQPAFHVSAEAEFCHPLLVQCIYLELPLPHFVDPIVSIPRQALAPGVDAKRLPAHKLPYIFQYTVLAQLR